MSRKEAIEAKIKELKARLINEANKEKSAQRKRDARMKIILGAKLMADSSQTGLVKKYTAEFKQEEKEREEKRAKKAKVEKATVESKATS